MAEDVFTGEDGMGRGRVKKAWVDPVRLARRAERRARERRWRRGFGIIVALGVVGLFALVMLIEAAMPEPRDVYRGRRERRETLLTWVAVEGTLAGMRRAGMSERWIVGGLAGVVLGCAGGVGFLVWRMALGNGKKEESKRGDGGGR